VFLLLALVVYRIGTHIPVPFINPDEFHKFFESQQGRHLRASEHVCRRSARALFDLLDRDHAVYLGLVIMQMLTYVLPSLESLRKEGESGRRKVTQYTRYATVGIATIQSFMAIKAIGSVRIWCCSRASPSNLSAWFAGDRVPVPDVAGRADHERGLGKRDFDHHFLRQSPPACPVRCCACSELVRTGALGYLAFFAIGALVILVTAVCGVRRTRPAAHPGQLRQAPGSAIRSMADRARTCRSKLNLSGVIPPIFASSIVLFPATVASWLSQRRFDALDPRLAAALQHGPSRCTCFCRPA